MSHTLNSLFKSIIFTVSSGFISYNAFRRQVLFLSSGIPWLGSDSTEAQNRLSLFYDAAYQECVAPNGRVVDKRRIENVEREAVVACSRCYAGIYAEGLRKPTKRITDVQACRI
jgi:uncharacterized protein YijF (DUF1287 family)